MRGVIIGDVTGAFLVGLPIAVVLGLHTPLGVVGVFLGRVLEELAKVAIFSRRSRRVSWEELGARTAGTAPSSVPRTAREVDELEQLV